MPSLRSRPRRSSRRTSRRRSAGRVFGVLNMLVSIASFVPIIIVGPISDAVGATTVIIVCGDAHRAVGHRVDRRPKGPPASRRGPARRRRVDRPRRIDADMPPGVPGALPVGHGRRPVSRSDRDRGGAGAARTAPPAGRRRLHRRHDLDDGGRRGRRCTARARRRRAPRRRRAAGGARGRRPGGPGPDAGEPFLVRRPAADRRAGARDAGRTTRAPRARSSSRAPTRWTRRRSRTTSPGGMRGRSWSRARCAPRTHPAPTGRRTSAMPLAVAGRTCLPGARRPSWSSTGQVHAADAVVKMHTTA